MTEWKILPLTTETNKQRQIDKLNKKKWAHFRKYIYPTIDNKSHIYANSNLHLKSLSAAGGISRRFLLLFIILSAVQLQCVSPSPLNHPLLFFPPACTCWPKKRIEVYRGNSELPEKSEDVHSGWWLAVQGSNLSCKPFSRFMFFFLFQQTCKSNAVYVYSKVTRVSSCARNAVSGPSAPQKSHTDICFCLCSLFSILDRILFSFEYVLVFFYSVSLLVNGQSYK